MRLVHFKRGGEAEVLKVLEVEDPKPQPYQVLIKVAAAAINNDDLLLRQGIYGPTPGITEFCGLECSGEIIAVGSNVSRWNIGDKVCAIVAGRAHAELVVAHSSQVIGIPDNVSLRDAAALPRAACLFALGFFPRSAPLNFNGGQTVLIHVGAREIPSMAIQIAKYFGFRVFITEASEQRTRFCKEVGADVCINSRKKDFAKCVMDETNGKGVDFILHTVDRSFMRSNINILATGGTIIVIEFAKIWVDIDPRIVAAKQCRIVGVDTKYLLPHHFAHILDQVEQHIWPAISSGEVKPIICKTFKFEEASKAHRAVTTSSHMGKSLLIP